MKASTARQLKHLAKLLPEMPVRLVNGKLIRQATNHERQLRAAYEDAGQQGVERYVARIKREAEALMKIIEESKQPEQNEQAD